MINRNKGSAMEIVGGEIRAQISAMAKNRAIFHESVAQKHFLTGDDIRSREENSSGWIDNARGDRRLVGVGSIGEHTEDQKTTNDHNHDRLNPAVRDQQRTACRPIHDGPFLASPDELYRIPIYNAEWSILRL